MLLMNDFSDEFLDLVIPGFCNISDMDPLINTVMNFATSKPIDKWDSNDVLNFIHNEISQKFIEIDHNINLHRFNCISGYIFKNLTEENCKLLSESNYIGEIIFNAKEKYIRYHQEDEFSSHSNDTIFPEGMENFYNLPSDQLSLEDNKTTNDALSPSPEFVSYPKVKANYDNKGKRSEKLWEFLLHLLQDKKTCPELIKWENFAEGTFKFVQSDKVARLWGNRKKNENMTYEKFSRAMRYYYKSEVLLPVPGKRLVYKFGPRAKGWNSIIPIH